MNLEWMQALSNQFPKIEEERKNIISIAGFPRWENVNSNLLSFYFDKNEEHGFNELFLNSLLDLYEEKIDDKIDFNRDMFATEYSIDREYMTDKGGRIDLLISEGADDEIDNNYIPKWAFIIENKLFANLYNDLTDYWNTINTDNKYGVVLSINPVEIDTRLEDQNIYYINITHKDLIDRIVINLPQYYFDSDDRHLLFLKEYISNINSHYKNKWEDINMDKILKLFYKNEDEIKRFKKQDVELLKYISKNVFEVMEENGFPPSTSKDSSKAKHFYVDSSNSDILTAIKDNIEVAGKFRFYINLGKLRYSNILDACFELWGRDNTIYGDELLRELEKKNIFTDIMQKGSWGKSGSSYQHIYRIFLPLGDLTKGDFKTNLKAAVHNNIFQHDNKFIETAVICLKNIIESDQSKAQLVK
jgi:PD-(D/E)XK nuclease superfamily